MAIKWLTTPWKTQEKAATKYERVYIDFRQYIYPPVNENTPGIFNEIVQLTDYTSIREDSDLLLVATDGSEMTDTVEGTVV